MGVTIESKRKSIDLGYSGFRKLRSKVAQLSGDDIFKHYEHLNDAPYLSEERKQFFKEYNKQIEVIAEKHNDELNNILDFLYESDCDGEMDVEHCESIYEIIKDYDDNILYGYCGRPDCAKFKDFKDIVKECIDTKTPMTWF